MCHNSFYIVEFYGCLLKKNCNIIFIIYLRYILLCLGNDFSTHLNFSQLQLKFFVQTKVLRCFKEYVLLSVAHNFFFLQLLVIRTRSSTFVHIKSRAAANNYFFVLSRRILSSTSYAVIFTVIYTYFLGALLLISEVLLLLEFLVFCLSRFRPSIETPTGRMERDSSEVKNAILCAKEKKAGIAEQRSLGKLQLKDK